ncbi:MAG TPA: prolyl oligopeptidase family serine peptidase [Vicinamibacterales bacterium]
MRYLLRAFVFLLWPSLGMAQEAVFPVPAGIRTDGVPPIPMSIADGVAPYGQFRQARFLGWHPTERRILISTVFSNVSQVHEVRMPGGARTQLTFFRDGVTGGASYDPSGRYALIRKDTSGGGEAMQLFRYDLDSGRITMLTNGKARHGVPAWSHRRGTIAYSSTKRNGKDRDLYVMNPLDPSSERILAEVNGTWDALDWSPDGKEVLALELIPGAIETRLWRIDVESNQRTLVTPKTGQPARWAAAQFSGDGRSVYALSDRDADVTRLWKCTLASGECMPFTEEGVAVEGYAASPAGGLVAVIVDRGSRSELQLVDESTRRQRPPVQLPPGVMSLGFTASAMLPATLAWHRSGAALAIEFVGARTFSDVYAVDAKSGRVERWTASEMGGANSESLPDAEIVEWKSFDGRAISGVLYRPAARFTGPRPVIINVHGGPERRERPRGLGRSNYFRNEMGIAIIYPNVRGSSGYGTTFEHLDDQRKREDAVKDIGALLDWIATKPDLDKTRVMITGSSYGGYITLAAAIAYGDRIRCALEGFGLSDFVAFLDGTDPSRRRDRLAEYGDPSDPEMRAFLKSISPLTHAAKLKIPLFIAQGAKDTRVPPDQAESMVKAVRANGTTVWYVVYDAGHEELPGTSNDFNQYAWVLFAQKFLLN